MPPATPFGQGLGNLPLLSTAQTRSICAENPTGEKGGAARAVPDEKSPARDLGPGWKVRPCIDIDPGATATLAEIDGPGVIQHIWITVDPKRLRDLTLRFYWDAEPHPSIEVPLGDFFCCGHNLEAGVSSLPIAVNPKCGLNSYWPMPFRKSARVTITSDHNQTVTGFFYQITYALQPVPDDAAYLHAQWRRALTTRECPEHTIIEGVEGHGHYVGTYLAWATSSDIWWGEGEIKFYIDGDAEHPTICGTGTEDYFGGAWGFYGENEREKPYSTPFLGLPLVHHVVNKVPKFGLYRWHIMDPIRFQQGLRVTIQALGWWPTGKFQPLCDDIASVAYWYQTEPHGQFPALPPVEQRWPR